ncbi:MAG TPA: cupin, partial [Pseudomonas sp.]|nr:cupin [Pseudomonas sp.]
MNITHFRDTPNVVLDTSNPVAVPLGEPVAVA